MLDSNKSATAMRALEVMEIVAEAGHPVSVAEVAEGIRADRSTAYRMLMTLHAAGYVTRDPSQKNYRLGYKLLSLSRRLLNGNDRADLIMRSCAKWRIGAERPSIIASSIAMRRCWFTGRKEPNWSRSISRSGIARPCTARRSARRCSPIRTRARSTK